MRTAVLVGHITSCLALAVSAPVCNSALAKAADSGGERTIAAVPEGLTSGDWSSIRAAYDAGRHAVVAVGEGHRARNPGQQWTTAFDGRGFLVQPDGGDWTWGLQLEGYGFAGADRAIVGAPSASVDGGRISYVWDATLTEWYVNDGRGLEHGYTVNEPPTRGAGPLRFTLAVRGELRPDVQNEGKDVRFVDAHGAAILNYAGLTVFDADGATVPARFETVTNGLLLTVDESGARYPLTIDPLAQQAYLKASNTGASDLFGGGPVAVSVSGDTVVIGARNEDSNATGVNGNQADDSAGDSGAAYVFVRSGTTWSQQAYLKASNTGAGDLFGGPVAVSGDTVVVGSPGEDSNATGVNGNQADDSAANSGAAYVFVRSGTTWSQQAYLKASNTGAGDQFGIRVAVSDDTVVVGANLEDSNAAGVNGNQTSNSAPDSGAAYVFVRSGATWSQQAYLKASNTGAGDRFGQSVAVSGDSVVVGSPSEDSNATGVNGNQASNSAPDSGAAYVLLRSGTTWTQQAYLKASSTDNLGSDQFGFSVAVSGDTVVVGSPGEDSNATGVNGNQADNSAPSAGAAYVFLRSGATWTQQAYLKASNTEVTDWFGLSVAVSGDSVVVGAQYEDSNAAGVNGDQANNSAPSAGAAYVFLRSGAAWSQQAYVKASNTEAGDQFGASVAVSGDTVVIGAVNEASNATGVDGDQANNAAAASGAAYVFKFEVPCIGDVNGDDQVDGADLGLLLGDWGTCGGCLADINLDGQVDGSDLGLLLGGWGGCPISNCCSVHTPGGCDLPACVSCVCAIEPNCCGAQWDGDCADLAAMQCNSACQCSGPG